VRGGGRQYKVIGKRIRDKPIDCEDLAGRHSLDAWVQREREKNGNE
jgi:hypothetical protein